jgi:hypothetical protein
MRIQAIDEQIQRLLALRRQWAEKRGLNQEQRRKRGPTLELLDGAIEDLRKKKQELLGGSTTKNNNA